MTWPTLSETDLYYSRLPFGEAQAKFSETAPDSTNVRLTTCGWHHTLFDSETGCVAIVDQDGPLVELLGERVVVTYDPARQSDTGVVIPKRSVVVYVHDSAKLGDVSISLARRPFLAIHTLAVDEITVSVSPTTALT